MIQFAEKLVRYALELQMKMSDIFSNWKGTYIDIKVDMAQFYREMIDIIHSGLESGVIPEDDRQFWQKQYDKLSKMDLSLLPDRQIIFQGN